ncbi:hypothetical protein CEF21_05555 [Bacillus sp. FJAT-42376]|uniref:hypothetical protein n=1 Tax=Bacillus sp. FJAT-42376 TaxID=2014076 RepID=UPI000F4FAEFB|nr:hypothetical protein [Bacillus sp. FJAT-42376]AZB41811.1 hypothetical protein CEF21_05555 [Bacillus sp. FJAT-42376]
MDCDQGFSADGNGGRPGDAVQPVNEKHSFRARLYTRPGDKKTIYSATKAEIASFVPLIVKEAEAGGKMALQIFQEAGIALAEMTLAAADRLGFENYVKMAVKGSVLQHILFVQTSFLDRIKQSKPEAEVITEDVSSALGCYYLARKEMTR